MEKSKLNMHTLPVIIGASYIYRNDADRQKFILVRVTQTSFHFKCGHWCSDNVFFDDMLPVESIQLSIF